MDLTDLPDFDTITYESTYLFVREAMRIRKEKAYLDNHKYKVYQGSDGRWYTRFPIKEGGSFQKAYRTMEEAIHGIIFFYESLEAIPTLEELFYEAMNRKLDEGSISKSTYTRNSYDFIRFYSEFGKEKVDRVSPDDLEEFIRLQKKKFFLDTKGYGHLIGVTRIIFKYARRKKLIDFRVEDVISDMDWGKNAFRTEREDEEEVFTDEEVEKLSLYFKGDPNGKHLGLLLCFLTGLRIGELSALKWEDVTDHEITIRRTETSWSIDGEFRCEVKNLPKTRAGKRRVPIPIQGWWIIDKLRELNPDGEYVFMMNGSRSRTIYFRKAMEKACDAVGIKRRSPHKIRKTYASILLDNNVGEKMVIENMGHTNIATTNGSYSRRRKTNEQRLAILNAVPEFDLIGCSRT